MESCLLVGLNQYITKGEVKRLTRSKFANLFLKKADRKTSLEK
jgi:hypothetical protein